MRIVVVGGGRLGATLAAALADANHAVTLVVRRAHRRDALRADPRWRGVHLVRDTSHAPPSDVDIWTVPDRALPDARVRAASSAPIALHAAGSLSADVLGAPTGVARGVLHPLAACPDPLTVRDTAPLRGASFGLSGDVRATAVAEALTRDLGGRPLPLPDGASTAYHAAAALAANDLAALLLAAERTGIEVGLEAEPLRRGLVHLARTALDALDRVPQDRPWVDGLTGAVARGDDATLRAHLHVLDHDARRLHAAASRGLISALGTTGRLQPVVLQRLRDVIDEPQ